MKNLPRKRPSPPPTKCMDCKDKFTEDNKFVYQGRLDRRCKPCKRIYHNKYNKKRAKLKKQSEWF